MWPTYDLVVFYEEPLLSMSRVIKSEQDVRGKSMILCCVEFVNISDEAEREFDYG